MTTEPKQQPITNEFMSKPGRWGGPNVSAARKPLSVEQLALLRQAAAENGGRPLSPADMEVLLGG
jgi:hypothetical protein